MPTITEKTPLGSLWGGKIASINYNFQVGNESSTATLTLVSETNSFSEPVMNESVSIPPFNITMNVVEFSNRDDTNYKVLQVELIDSLYEILDKELVLIYGEHTTFDYKLNDNLYYFYKTLFIPTSYYPIQEPLNPNITYPNLINNYVKSYGNGINVIGFPRASYVSNSGLSFLTDSEELQIPSEWWSFDAGVLNSNISSNTSNFTYSSSQEVDVKFGYTLFNLYKLLKAKGISFDSSSERIMLDQNIMFSEYGTIRNVLSTCLNKMGRTFYVDPFTQKIKIISNSDISRINNNLNNNYSNFSSIEGATQVSLKKSIKDVEANHFVIKGDLEFGPSSSFSSSGESQRVKKQLLYKLDGDSLAGDLEKRDISLLARVAPLASRIDDKETLDLYIFGLSLIYPIEDWGKIYGSDEEKFSFDAFTENTPAIVDRKTGEVRYKEAWQTIISEGNGDFEFVFYDTRKTAGARAMYSVDDEGDRIPAIKPSEIEFFKRVENYTRLWSGVYFSAPMTENQALKRQYINQARWYSGGDTTFQYITVKGDTKIGEVQELRFLFELLKSIDAKTTYTVAEVAEKVYPDSLVRGDGDYYTIGIRDLFLESNIDVDNIYKLIRSTFYALYVPQREKSYLLYTHDALDNLRAIEKAAMEASQAESELIDDVIVAKYTTLKEDSEAKSANSPDSLSETPQSLYIRNIESNVKNFSKRSLTIFSDRILETQLFLSSIGDINPNFSGPFITTEIEYDRPPNLTDFSVENGVDSVSVSTSEQGIKTSVKYSSRKFAQVDSSILREYLGATGVTTIRRNTLSAFQRNSVGF